MISDDEYLERVVAGIQAATTAGADVRWNDVINGRQFDVSVRFALGTLRYLVLVEVKNRSRKASATDLDAFVSKARDQNANKAVFVTAAGFQTGAVAVAERHAVDLFTVKFDTSQVLISRDANLYVDPSQDAISAPLEIIVGEAEKVNAIEKVTLVYHPSGKKFEIPDEPSQMTYYVCKTRLEDGRTLNQLIERHQLPAAPLGGSLSKTIVLRPPQSLTPPDDYHYPAGTVTHVELLVVGREARIVRGNTRFESGLFTSPILYTNVRSGKEMRFPLDTLPLGHATVSPGNFYFTPNPLMYYYCDSIVSRTVRWHVVESFQLAQMVRGTFTQNVRESWRYIPVSDKRIAARLQRRLGDYLALRGGAG